MADTQLTQTGAQVQADLNLVENLEDAFSTSETYLYGDLCIYNNCIYKCIYEDGGLSGYSGPWDSTKFQQIKLQDINRPNKYFSGISEAYEYYNKIQDYYLGSSIATVTQQEFAACIGGTPIVKSLIGSFWPVDKIQYGIIILPITLVSDTADVRFYPEVVRTGQFFGKLTYTYSDVVYEVNLYINNDGTNKYQLIITANEIVDLN